MEVHSRDGILTRIEAECTSVRLERLSTSAWRLVVFDGRREVTVWLRTARTAAGVKIDATAEEPRERMITTADMLAEQAERSTMPGNG
jgi:hypothetical protein